MCQGWKKKGWRDWVLISLLKLWGATEITKILPLLSPGFVWVTTPNRKGFRGCCFLNLQGIFTFEYKAQWTEGFAHTEITLFCLCSLHILCAGQERDSVGLDFTKDCCTLRWALGYKLLKMIPIWLAEMVQLLTTLELEHQIELQKSLPTTQRSSKIVTDNTLET